MSPIPEWLRLGDGTLGPLIADTSSRLKQVADADYHVSQLPTLALFHFAHAMQTSIDINREGRHAVALALLRHAVEALTVIELGLLATNESARLLEDFDSGKKTQGALRQALEASVWPRYGMGLWSEPWSEYYGRLAKAVQPYAHCSPELIQWNLSVASLPDDPTLYATAGRYDAIKASRLTLFHVLVTWTLGRIVHANPAPRPHRIGSEHIQALGAALAASEFLIPGQDWSVQLWPHMLSRDRVNGRGDR